MRVTTLLAIPMFLPELISEDDFWVISDATARRFFREFDTLSVEKIRYITKTFFVLTKPERQLNFLEPEYIDCDSENELTYTHQCDTFSRIVNYYYRREIIGEFALQLRTWK